MYQTHPIALESELKYLQRMHKDLSKELDYLLDNAKLYTKQYAKLDQEFTSFQKEISARYKNMIPAYPESIIRRNEMLIELHSIEDKIKSLYSQRESILDQQKENIYEQHKIELILEKQNELIPTGACNA